MEAIDRFRRPLLSFFGRRLRNRDEAEDLTQEVFVRLARHPDPAGIRHLQGYVYQIAANLLRDRLRRQSRHGETSDPAGAAVEEIREEIDPERVLSARQELARVAAALQALPERTREIFVLYRLENMRQSEIAETLGVSLSTVEKHLVKAMTELTRRCGRP